MENDFFNMYEAQSCLSIEIGHNSVADWCMIVYDRRGTSIKNQKEVFRIQECDRKMLFSKAYNFLADHLNDARGGY